MAILIELPLSCYRTKASETSGFLRQKGKLRSLAYMLNYCQINVTFSSVEVNMTCLLTECLNEPEQETLQVKCLDTLTSLLLRFSCFK